MLRLFRTYRLLPVLLSLSLLGSTALLCVSADCVMEPSTWPGQMQESVGEAHPCSSGASVASPASARLDADARIGPSCLQNGMCCTVQQNQPPNASMPAVVIPAHHTLVGPAGVLPATVQADGIRLAASSPGPPTSPRHLLPPCDRQALFSTFLT